MPQTMRYLPRGKRTTRSRRGSALVEFAISFPFLSLLTIGTFAVGVTIDRYLTVAQLVRDGGNMYARGVDFSADQNKQLLLMAASGMGMTTTGGNGVLYLSTVVEGDSGANRGVPVIAHRIVIGDSSFAASSAGMPTTVQANGDVSNANTDSAARAQLPTGLTVTGNERIFVAEVFHKPVGIQFPGFFAPTRIYSRAFF